MKKVSESKNKQIDAETPHSINVVCVHLTLATKRALPAR
jgi:hypothetical protein